MRHLTPGGRLVTPTTIGDALLVLTKTTDNRLDGHVGELPVAFMPLRATPHVSINEADCLGVGAGDPTEPFTPDVDPTALHNPDFQFWLATTHPHLRLALGPPTQGHSIIYTVSHSATVQQARDGAGWPGEQDEARLWDMVERSWHRFDDAGQPRRDCLDVTARRGGHLEFRVNEKRRLRSVVLFPHRHHPTQPMPSGVQT